MSDKEYPVSLEEAQRYYDECRQKQKKFLEKYEEILNKDFSVTNGEESNQVGEEWVKRRMQKEAIEKECSDKYDRLQEFVRAKKADDEIKSS